MADIFTVCALVVIVGEDPAREFASLISWTTEWEHAL
jgi:hypothetical protein